ncbi:MAG: IS5 family transposase [Acidithiobacillus sp.]
MAGLVGQTGFFPGDRRLGELDLLGDGLPLLNRLVPWERFRLILESVPKAKPKGPGGRKPYDRIPLFKMMVLQQLHNLSDEQTEYQIRDRLSFQGIGLEELVPDHTTLWLFRESLAQAQLTERLFTAFHTFLREASYAARAGQIIDASFVTVPRQHLRRKEREQVKYPPRGRSDPPSAARKIPTPRWTKKNGQSTFGYKNHINVDKRYKLIHQYVVTDASVHDSQCLEALLDAENSGVEVFADSAYRSEESEHLLQEQGYRNRIHEKSLPQPTVNQSAGTGQYPQVPSPCPGRACFLCPHPAGWQVGADRGQGPRCWQDWDDESNGMNVLFPPAVVRCHDGGSIGKGGSPHERDYGPGHRLGKKYIPAAWRGSPWKIGAEEGRQSG